MSLRAVVLGLATVALLAVACGDGGEDTAGLSLKCPSKEAPEPPSDLAALSLDEVYEQMAESMTCPGYALKLVKTRETDWQGFSMSLRQEAWIDVPGRKARDETRVKRSIPAHNGEPARTEEGSRVEIILGVESYSRGSDDDEPRNVEGLTCRGTDDALISLLLLCRGYTERAEARFVPSGAFEDPRVPAILVEGSTSDSDNTFRFKDVLLLDRATLLPLALSGAGEKAVMNRPEWSDEARYKYEFVPVDSLSADFFDPGAVGCGEPDPEDELRGADIDIVLYWLGREFPGGEGLPPLSLARAYPVEPRPQGQPPPQHRAVMEYRAAEVESGPTAVTLQIYTRVEWDAFLAQSSGGNLWKWACTRRWELDLGDWRAVILGGYVAPATVGDYCPADAPSNRWGAYVYIRDTVVLVAAPIPNPYNSREGMEAVVGGLLPRPPD